MTDRQIKKNACKNVYLGSIFIPEKYMIRVLFVSPWTSLIPPLAIRVAPRAASHMLSIQFQVCGDVFRPSSCWAGGGVWCV